MYFTTNGQFWTERPNEFREIIKQTTNLSNMDDLENGLKLFVLKLIIPVTIGESIMLHKIDTEIKKEMDLLNFFDKQSLKFNIVFTMLSDIV